MDRQIGSQINEQRDRKKAGWIHEIINKINRTWQSNIDTPTPCAALLGTGNQAKNWSRTPRTWGDSWNDQTNKMWIVGFEPREIEGRTSSAENTENGLAFISMGMAKWLEPRFENQLYDNVQQIVCTSWPCILAGLFVLAMLFVPVVSHPTGTGDY